MSYLSRNQDPSRVNNRIIQLALPMAGTQLITMGSGFLCMTMLAQLGHNVLAASALIFSISMAIILIGMSLLFSLSILVGHAYGAKDFLGVGTLVQHGWLLAIILSIPIMIIFWNIYPILVFFGQEKFISQIVQEFFRANIWRATPILLAVCNQQLCYGVHKQKIDMIANLIGIVVLVCSSYLLIFGKWGFPHLGVAGFGYATALQAWFYFLFTTACLYFIPDFNRFHLFQFRLHHNWQTLAYLFKTAWPISLQINGEMFSFLISATFIGWLGTESLAAYQVLLQYNFLIVIPIFALSQASGILIGQAYGSKKFMDIRKLGLGSLRISVVITLIAAMILILFPKMLASVYLDVNNPANAATVHLIILLFLILAFAQFLDGIRNVLTGALRGQLDTRFPMIIGLVSLWLIGMPLGYLFAFPLHGGVIGIISGWTVGILIGTIVLTYRWHRMSMCIAGS